MKFHSILIKNERKIKYFLSFIIAWLFSLLIVNQLSDSYRLFLIIFIILVPLLITYLNVQLSIHYSLVLYSIIAKTFHLKNPNVNYIDDDGVPYVDYGYKNGNYVGVQRNPLTISNKADQYHSLYLRTNEPIYLRYFQNCIAFLESVRQTREHDGIDFDLYPYQFVVDEEHQDFPWYSAMAQSAISLTFTCAYHSTGDPQYQQRSDLAMNALRVRIQDGGVLDIDTVDQGYWFEEVASAGRYNARTNILNGHLFSIIDLLKYRKERPADHVERLISNAIQEVKNHITEYDLGYWTYYDRVKNFAYDYHFVHTQLFRELFHLTGDPFFQYYYRKWRRCLPLNPLWARKRFAAYVLNLGIFSIVTGGLFFFFNLHSLEFLSIIV